MKVRIYSKTDGNDSYGGIIEHSGVDSVEYLDAGSRTFGIIGIQRRVLTINPGNVVAVVLEAEPPYDATT